jgi:hypothetical protein
MKAPVRGEGNCGEVTIRGKEACEDVRKRWVCTNSLPRLFTPRPARLRTETPYEADVLDERAGDREVDPETGTEVDGELGQGQITFLFGEICCAYLGVSIIG